MNNLVYELAQKAGVLVWLGLRCSDTVAENCQWDDGKGPSSPYNAFYPGYPSTAGSCVLMMIGGQADGKWISGDCDIMQIGFACQITKQNFIEFNGQCYNAFQQQLSMSAAESICVEHCGHLASIHNQDENLMIGTLFEPQTNYAAIGLKRQTSGTYNWTDQSSYDFDNFGTNDKIFKYCNSNPAFGECVAMSLVKELVNTGQWITVSCGQALPFVCKRALDDNPCERALHRPERRVTQTGTGSKRKDAVSQRK
ncbi:lectin C-type domain protein [Cooperia oncophora]